jgi:hypothetical protein
MLVVCFLLVVIFFFPLIIVKLLFRQSLYCFITDICGLTAKVALVWLVVGSRPVAGLLEGTFLGKLYVHLGSIDTTLQTGLESTTLRKETTAMMSFRLFV